MPESLKLTHDTIKLSHTAEGEPIETRPAIEDTAVLNDEVMIELRRIAAADRSGLDWRTLDRVCPSWLMTPGLTEEDSMDPDGYPWYRVVQGEELVQGDLFDRCPVLIPPADMAEPLDEAVFSWEERDVIVMTQTCDLVPGREKVTEVLLCAAWNRSDLKSGHLATCARPRRRTTRKSTWIPSARGNRPARRYARAPHRGLSARLLAAVDVRPQARGSDW